MTDASPTPVRYVVGLRLRRNGPLLWRDPGDFEPRVGQQLVIATEDGERTTQVAVGPSPVPPGFRAPRLRVLRTADAPDDLAGACVDAVDQTPRHASSPVGTTRVARLINRLLDVRRRHPGATPPLVDLGQALPSDDSERSAPG